MNHNDKEIVLAIRAALAERIGRDRFDVWFSAGVRLRADGRQVRVIASDQFLLDRVRSQFRGDLEIVGKQVFGAAVVLDFQLDPAVSARQPVPPKPSSSSRSAAEWIPPAATWTTRSSPTGTVA